MKRRAISALSVCLAISGSASAVHAAPSAGTQAAAVAEVFVHLAAEEIKLGWVENYTLKNDQGNLRVMFPAVSKELNLADAIISRSFAPEWRDTSDALRKSVRARRALIGDAKALLNGATQSGWQAFWKKECGTRATIDAAEATARHRAGEVWSTSFGYASTFATERRFALSLDPTTPTPCSP